MRLCRMVLENFRGIEGPREIVFAEHGITLIEGPNEAGKSSVAEALRLVRDFKASSQAADVRAVRPTHVQADPRVEVELRTGSYHLTYAKTFGRKGSTTLVVHAPHAESHTGDAAHDRATAIFAETVDAELWRALHLVQGAPLDQPVLAELEPLHVALAERGQGEGTEVHADLLERVEAEYLQLFTPTGRPTGQYARLREQVDAAASQAEQAQEAVEKVSRLVQHHERVRTRREELDAELVEQRKEVQALRDRSDRLDQLREEHREARQVARAAEHAVAAAAAVQRRRHELLQEATDAVAAVQSARSVLAQAELELAAAPAADSLDAASEAELELARSRMDSAAALLDAVRTEGEFRRAQEQLERAASAGQAVAEAAEVLAAQVVDPHTYQQLLDLHSAWQTARTRSEAGAPQILVERQGEDVPMVDGQPLQDQQAQLLAVSPTVIQTATVRITVTPDEQIAEQAHEAQRLRLDYERLLEQLAVRDLDDARDQLARTHQARLAVETAGERLRAVLDGATEAELAAQVATIASRRAASPPSTDLGQAQDELAQAKADYELALHESSAARQERARRAAVIQGLRERLATATAEAAQAEARCARADGALAAAREERSDDEVAATLQHAQQESAEAAATLAALERDLQAQGADHIAADLATAQEVLAATEHHAQELDADLVGADAQLELLGRDGLQDAANRAAEQLADVERSWASIDARARAARRLHHTLTTHAQLARQRYVAPFREAISELGRTVFGADFAVDIADDLSITSRTLDGRTIPFASLSGGAREQLGVLGRVATARLVGQESGAPVILDDALGYADHQRRQRMMAVLHQVAREGSTQIIVLTCEPARFSRLVPQARVRLEA